MATTLIINLTIVFCEVTFQAKMASFLNVCMCWVSLFSLFYIIVSWISLGWSTDKSIIKNKNKCRTKRSRRTRFGDRASGSKWSKTFKFILIQIVSYYCGAFIKTERKSKKLAKTISHSSGVVNCFALLLMQPWCLPSNHNTYTECKGSLYMHEKKFYHQTVIPISLHQSAFIMIPI